MRTSYPRRSHQNSNKNAKIHLEQKKRKNITIVFHMKRFFYHTFCANSEQHESRHLFKRDLDGCVCCIMCWFSGVGVSQRICVVPLRLSGPSCWLEETESECWTCGVWGVGCCNGVLAADEGWCKPVGVKPPNGPFGESPVTTTEGARTLRGLKIAGISPSRAIFILLKIFVTL